MGGGELWMEEDEKELVIEGKNSKKRRGLGQRERRANK